MIKYTLLHRVQGDETEKFNTLSSTWWKDEKDALLLMNSVRIPLIQTVAQKGDRILDAGCGGGYLSEVCYSFSNVN